MRRSTQDQKQLSAVPYRQKARPSLMFRYRYSVWLQRGNAATDGNRNSKRAATKDLLIRREYFFTKNGYKKERLKISRKLSAIVTSRSLRDKDVPRPAFTEANDSPDTPVAPKLGGKDGDGDINNEILADLPCNEKEVVSPKLEVMRLALRQVLHEPGDAMKSAYFCDSGLISILSVFPDGKSVEVGLIGNEGFIGLPLIVGFRTATTRAVVQIESMVYRIDGEALAGILPQCPTLERRLQQFAQIMTMQVTQIAACNRLHEVVERLGRWLLMSADRIGSNSVPLTQELLAQMLGTRRSSVTVAAGTLQKAGLIAYTRGEVRIVDRRGLEGAACECYEIMLRQVNEWKKESE
jgi:CRP-like cAMP-binding protein